MFIPEEFEYDGLTVTLSGIASSVLSVSIVRKLLDHAEWSSVLKDYDITIIYVPAGYDFSVTPKLQRIQDSALALLDAAQVFRLRCVVISPLLDAALRLRLLPCEGLIFVSMGLARSFPALFRDALQQLSNVTVDEIQNVRFTNLRVELLIVISKNGILFRSADGYQAAEYEPRNELGDGSPLSFIELWRFISSRSDPSDFQQVHHLGVLIGEYLLKNERIRGLYASLIDMVRELYAMPVYVQLDSELQDLPVEIAILTPQKQMLCLLHPVVRQIPSSSRRRQWSVPQSRGLRVLIIESDASGRIEHCHHADQKCSPDGLPAIGFLADERLTLSDFFNTQRLWRIERLQVLSRLGSSVGAVTKALGQQWDIIHYVGHSRTYKEYGRTCGCLFVPVERTALISRAQAVANDYWINAIAAQSPDALVYLSSCDTANGGLCASIARNKSCEAVGFQGRVETEAAFHMATLFYEALLQLAEQGKANVARALLLARVKMMAKGVNDQLAAYLCTAWMGNQLNV